MCFLSHPHVAIGGPPHGAATAQSNKDAVPCPREVATTTHKRARGYVFQPKLTARKGRSSQSSPVSQVQSVRSSQSRPSCIYTAFFIEIYLIRCVPRYNPLRTPTGISVLKNRLFHPRRERQQRNHCKMLLVKREQVVQHCWSCYIVIAAPCE